MAIEDLLKNWDFALESYGTPKDFGDHTEMHLVGNQTEDIPIRLIIARGYAQRKHYMDMLTMEKETRKGFPQRWINDGAACFLCDNVGQAQRVQNNLLLPFEMYPNHIVVPNRFPAERGHILLMSKKHDTSDKKIGNSVTSEYLHTIAELALKYDFCVNRNHAKAGMSIPHHEHVHLHPGSIDTLDKGGVYRCGLMDSKLTKTPFGEDILRVMDSKFDTIAVRGNNAIDVTIKVLDKLEQAKYIFTFVYYAGTFFISPHVQEMKKIGATDPEYVVILEPGQSFSYKEHMDYIKDALPKKGSFDWKAFF